MRLIPLLAELNVLKVRGDPAAVRLRGVACHSAEAGPGKVFVCIRGEKHDGHRFIEDALGKGASAIVVEADSPESPAVASVPVIHVKDTRRAYALLCAAWAGHPSRHLHVTGVTGTNGKTTTALFLDAIFRAAGLKTGLVTTVFTRVGDDSRPQALTTPEAGALQRALARMADEHVERVVLEASSHALDMHRTAGTVLKTAVFTNLARDHLDYHGDRNEYARAKARIFELLDGETGVAVINVDDRAGRGLACSVGRPTVTYAFRRPADVRGMLLSPGSGPFPGPESAKPGDRGAAGRRLRLVTPTGDAVIALPPPGTANAANALAAAAAAWSQGVPLPTIAKGLSSATLPPGRFQEIRCGQPFRVVVDFAHNPAGLALALSAFRAEVDGRLLLVFGCKGDDRDERKRRLMGRIAGSRADAVVITTDNPFNECPRLIAQIVARGAAAAGRPRAACRIVLDRGEAIRFALAQARAGDGVLIAGRGHEREQRFGDKAVPLDDAAVAAEWLQARYAPAFV